MQKPISTDPTEAELFAKNLDVKILRGDIKARDTAAVLAELERFRSGHRPTDEPPRKTIASFADEYLKWVEVNRATSTYRRYTQVVRQHFADFAKQKQVTYLDELKSEFFEDYKQYRLRCRVLSRGLNDTSRGIVQWNTVKREMVIIQSMMSRAVNAEHLSVNPMKKVERMKERVTRDRFLSEEEVDLILANCSPRQYPIWVTFLQTGMREGELVNLEWNDIDFERRMAHVQVKEFWQPKTSEPRSIPMSSFLYETLRQHRRQCSPGVKWVFSAKSGQQVRHLLREFKALCHRLGIEGVTLHTMRHTFASHLIMRGVDIRTVQKLMGHKSIDMTMRYAHLAPDHLKNAVEKLPFQPPTRGQKPGQKTAGESGEIESDAKQ